MPAIVQRLAPAACIAGEWASTPAGVILHGSRSGQPLTTADEYAGTVSYIVGGARDGEGTNLGWNATIGDGEVAIHLDCRFWGWNAREASHQYLAVEFAQAQEHLPISDQQVNAFAWWFATIARATWPNLPATFPMHSELPAGQRDGKTDTFANGDPLADQLRTRIMAALAQIQSA